MYIDENNIKQLKISQVLCPACKSLSNYEQKLKGKVLHTCNKCGCNNYDFINFDNNKE